METKENLELELHKRREFFKNTISRYNKRLPKRILISLVISLLYSFIRVRVNPEEKISFYTTFLLIGSLFIVIVIIEHITLLKRIRKALNELNQQAVNLKSEGLI